MSKHLRMKVYEHGDKSSMAIVRGEWSSSHSVYFTCGKRTSSTYWIGQLVSSRASLDIIVKRKVHVHDGNQATVSHPMAKHFSE
jgi:hypothetical protein